MAKLTTAEFIEAIKELSVLELNELVKACEEEFGVSAAAGVVVAAAGAGAAAEEEKTEFDVELTEVGPNTVSYTHLPCIIIHDHMDQHVAREHLAFHLLLSAVLQFDNLFQRDGNL